MRFRKPFIVGIAGGTGSGKTTLAIELYKKDTTGRSLIHLDDYFKKAADVPSLNGLKNWEHPSALKLDDLYQDLVALQNGETITIQTKSEHFNPGYNHKAPVWVELSIEPKPVLIVEGFLLFHDPRIRDLCDLKVFLDAPLWEATQRRSQTKEPVDQEYYEKVFVPMFEETVTPTKVYADIVIDTFSVSKRDLIDQIEGRIPSDLL